WARPVIVPCPISERATRTTTVSSGRMTTQALISGEPSWARTTLLPNGMFKPRANPPPTAAVPTRKERRSIFRVLAIMAAPPYALIAKTLKIDRRSFLVGTAAVGGGLALG